MLPQQKLLKSPHPLVTTGHSGQFPARIAGAVSQKEWGFPEIFILSQTVLPALLYLPGTQSFRVLIRISGFLISLVALAWYGKKIVRASFQVSSQKWLGICTACVLAMIFHPTTNSLLSGTAQAMLYVAVLAPMFWAPQLSCTPERVRRLLVIILICSGLNSVVGVLQVYDPGTWMPKDISSVMTDMQYGLDSVSYYLPDGQRIIRPAGLTDSPGAVGAPAAIATVLGLIFCFDKGGLLRRIMALASALAGFAALFLSQIRSSLLVACGALVVYAGLLATQRHKSKALVLVLLGALAVFGSFSLAITLGGESVQERFALLLQDNPIDVYYNARGSQLESGLVVLLPEYPLGAGLGRWGMMRHYFGDESNTNSPAIWSEIQFNSWILDGGIILLIFYLFALVSATWAQIKVARTAHSPDLHFCAAAIVAINASVLALIFSYVPFTSQAGLQYWFLSGVLLGAVPGVEQ